MSRPNRVTLEQFAGMATREAEGLPLDQIAALYEDAAGQRATLKAAEFKLHAIMSGRFAGRAADARRAAGKDTGVVHVEDGDFVVSIDTPKSVDWDQVKLTNLANMIEDEWKQPVRDYITIKLAVDERKFTAWPTPLRAHFEPARTVKAGKPVFEIEPRDELRATA